MAHHGATRQTRKCIAHWHCAHCDVRMIDQSRSSVARSLARAAEKRVFGGIAHAALDASSSSQALEIADEARGTSLAHPSASRRGGPQSIVKRAVRGEEGAVSSRSWPGHCHAAAKSSASAGSITGGLKRIAWRPPTGVSRASRQRPSNS